MVLTLARSCLLGSYCTPVSECSDDDDGGDGGGGGGGVDSLH